MIKNIIYSLIIFIVLYFEPTQVGPITFSQLWKIPLFIYLLFFVLRKRIKHRPSFIYFSYARAIKNLFNGSILISPFTESVTWIRYMMFPLMYEVLSSKIKNVQKLNHLLLFFAQFVILSGLPFIFGWIQSQTEGIEIGDFTSYTGIFQTVHAASTTTAIALLVLVYEIKTKQLSTFSHWKNIFLILLGIYLLYLSFARTGYLMFILGLIILFLPEKMSAGKLVQMIAVIGLLAFGLIYLLETNELFYNRIFDIRYGRQTDVGSGRLELWKLAYLNWLNSDYIHILFGHGMYNFKEIVFSSTGHRVHAHNEFFTHLMVNGLIGIFLIIGFLFQLLKFIWKRRIAPGYRLSLATFFLYLSLMMTQGDTWFPVEVFMVLIFVKLQREYEKEISISDLNSNQLISTTPVHIY